LGQTTKGRASGPPHKGANQRKFSKIERSFEAQQKIQATPAMKQCIIDSTQGKEFIDGKVMP